MAPSRNGLHDFFIHLNLEFTWHHHFTIGLKLNNVITLFIFIFTFTLLIISLISAYIMLTRVII
jgi:hypothetical protein